jgi:hypothetical protein
MAQAGSANTYTQTVFLLEEISILGVEIGSEAMTAPMEQLKQELAALQAAVVAIAQESYELYDRYLQTLGKSLRQQLILASYHVCTQVYPEHFLELSLAQRQELQTNLQQLGNEAARSLAAALGLLLLPEQASLDTLSELVESQEILEIKIAEILHETSRTVNQLLQTDGVLPSTPMEHVLEIAAEAESVGHPVTRSPNLLTALLDPEEEDQPQTATVIGVYLQLGEIEFNDNSVMLQHNQIRQLTARLHRLQKEVEQKQQAQLAAEAVLVWRSTWQDE